jgi:hypothetical protein
MSEIGDQGRTVEAAEESGSPYTEEYVYEVVGSAFAPDYYLKQYPDIRQSGVDPLNHYLQVGCKEGRDPSAVFSTRYYLEQNPDVVAAGQNPLFHYVKFGIQERRRPVPLPAVYKSEQQYQFVQSIIRAEFDTEFYSSQYPGHKREILDPLEHFLLLGYRTGNNPAPDFSVSDYLAANPDVRASGVNPYYHYLVLGRMEGRKPSNKAEEAWLARFGEDGRTVLAAEFDAEYYLHRNPDVRTAGMDPLEHYIRFGWKEGRDPTPGFSTSYYLQINPDVQKSGVNPFYHYLMKGREEGRHPVLPGGHVARTLYSLRSLEQQVADWRLHAPETQDPVSKISLIKQLDRWLEDGAPRMVISVGHDDYRTIVGGVQHCILLEQQAVQSAGALYLNINPVVPLPVLASAADRDSLLLNVLCNGEHLGVVSTRDFLHALQETRSRIGTIDLVVHTLLGHSPESVRMLGESVVNGQCIYWVHDYQSICPGYNLLRNGVQYCGAPEADSMACSVCIYGEERSRQLPRLRELFGAVDFTVLAPSDHAAELWQRKADLYCRKLVIMPHTRFVERDGSAPAQELSSGDAVLRVAFPGYPLSHKGWPVFMKLVNANRQNPALEFHVLSVQESNELAGVRHTPVLVSAQDPAAMQDAMAHLHIDLAFIWSIWPETYCLTAHEAVAAGVPVLTCAQSGNVAQLVEERDCGLVFEDEDEMLAAFESGEIHAMVGALRERMAARPMGIQHNTMSVQQLGLQSKS